MYLCPCWHLYVQDVCNSQAYDVTHMISSLYYKGYASLTKIQRIEWNNRGMSSAHAIFITAMSLYLVFFSDLFSDRTEGLVIFRSSSLSIFTLGVSVGYFVSDLAMIFWLYPSLGGIEYVLHHLLSATAISYTMLSGEGQLYTYMVLISETTTPGINLRWFLDTAGMKKSSAYLVNGVMMFIAWLVARILLFIYLFYYIYLYYDQADAHFRLPSYFAGTRSTIYHEHHVVYKDSKGTQKDTSQAAMIVDVHKSPV
ncbi:uncharacterized protein LOC103982215 isoform X5 [Musa acuminata AAA Group]|uniref:uncharacterized protein LOC103982215 isoform X5 n=1 Tax=Musa acuminata AAA Group TaxID=214697 RepID=UPI0031D303F2